MSESLPEIERLAGLLPYSDPAEVHGLLCGMVCIEPALGAQDWLERLEEALPEGQRLVQEARPLLLELFTGAVSQLDDPELGFYLLLPADQAALSRRAEALGAWCQGFLAGLGLGGLRPRQALIPEVREFLQDVADIAQVGFDTDQEDEEDEAAYIEIVEYLRMGVLLIRQTLGSRSDPSLPIH